MKKLFSVFASIGIATAPIIYVIGCNPAPDLPYIPNNKISENTRKVIDKIVLGDSIPERKISSLFDYDLDEFTDPNFFPSKNIMSIDTEQKDQLEQMEQNFNYLKKIKSNEDMSKKDITYMKKSLLSSNDLTSGSKAVVEKYNSYLSNADQVQAEADLYKIASYFDNGIKKNTDLHNKKRWLYVDQIRSAKAGDWINGAHSWTLNPENPDYDEKTEYDQGIFYHILLNAFLAKVKENYNVNLEKIWNWNVNKNSISSDIAGITFAFTVWDPLKWWKHFVDNRPVISSNENIFENLPVLPIEEVIGVKIVIADIYGTISNYLIGNFVISNLLNIE